MAFVLVVGAPTAEDAYENAMMAAYDFLQSKDAKGALRECQTARKHIGRSAQSNRRRAAVFRCYARAHEIGKRWDAAHAAYTRAVHAEGVFGPQRETLRKRQRAAAAARKMVRTAEALATALRDDRALRRNRNRVLKGVMLERALAELSKSASRYRAAKDWGAHADARALDVVLRARGADLDGARRLLGPVRRLKALRDEGAALLLEAEYFLELEGAPTKAIGALIKANRKVADLADEPTRTYSRRPLLRRACQAYDRAHVVGACARRELELTGTVTLTDRSAWKKKPELSDQDLEDSHAEFLPALELCVLEAARKDVEAFEHVDLRIEWTITPEGRAIGRTISPGRYEKDLAACVDERLGWLRYRRVRSQERKNVSVPYRLD